MLESSAQADLLVSSCKNRNGERESMIHEQRVIACIADLFVVEVIRLLSLKPWGLSVNHNWAVFLSGTVQ